MAIKLTDRHKPLNKLLAQRTNTNLIDQKHINRADKIYLPTKLKIASTEMLELDDICRKIDHTMYVTGVRTESLKRGHMILSEGKGVPFEIRSEKEQIAYMFNDLTKAITNPPHTKDHLFKLNKVYNVIIV